MLRAQIAVSLFSRWLAVAVLVWFAGCGAESTPPSSSKAGPSSLPSAGKSDDERKTASSAKPASRETEEPAANEVPPPTPPDNAVALVDAPRTGSSGARSGKDLPVPSDAFMSMQIGNLQAAWQKWQKTTYFAWSHSAPMKPFKQELVQNNVPSMMNPQAFLGFAEDKLGLFPDPAVFYMVPGAGQEVESGFIIQSSDQDAIGACLASAAEHFAGRKWPGKEVKVPGATRCIVYTGPKDKDGSSPQRIYFTTPTSFGITSHTDVANKYAAGLKADLAQDAEYQQTGADARKFAGDAAADATWFMRPMAWIYHVKPKPAEPPPVLDKKGKPKTPKKRDDYGVVLKRQGFDSLKAIAGVVTVDGLNHEPEQAMSVLAPAPYQKGMKMLDWQPGKLPKLPSWVPGKLASLSIIHIQAEKGFDGFGHWFDEMNRSVGLFDDVLKGLKADAAGPQVDLREDLVKNMNPTVVLLVDYAGKLTKENPQGKRTINYYTTDKAQAVSAALEKFFKNDPNVKREEINGWVVWTAAPGKSLMLEGTDDRLPKVECMALKSADLLSANTGEWIREVIANKGDGGLSADADYKAADAQWKPWETNLTSMRGLNNTQLSMQRSFEGLRSGDKSLDKTQETRMLRMMLAGDPDGDKGINYKSLPPYAEIRKYLLSNATSVQTVKTGMEARMGFLKP